MIPIYPPGGIAAALVQLVDERIAVGVVQAEVEPVAIGLAGVEAVGEDDRLLDLVVARGEADPAPEPQPPSNCHVRSGTRVPPCGAG